MDGSTDKIRTVATAAPFRWIWDAINIGRRGAGAIFGGAGLLLLAAIGAMIALGMAMSMLFMAARNWPAMSIVFTVAGMILVVLGMAFAIVGYLRLIDAVESGRGASASDAFRGFQDVRAGIRTFAVLLLLMLIQQALMMGLVAWLMPELGRWYLAVMHDVANASRAPPPVPTAFWKFYPLTLALGLVGNWVQTVALAQVALGGRGIGGALRDGVVSLLRNLPALLVLIVAGIAFALAILVVVLIAVLAVVLIGKLVATWLAAVLGIALYLAFFVAIIAVGCASMYYMWRDIAGPGAVPAQAAVEA
jgi:hypothetical protein